MSVKDFSGAGRLTITSVCKCGEMLDVPEEHAGKHVCCPVCQRLTRVSGEKICLLPPEEKTIKGVWRKDNLLVVRQGAMLPGRCVKSGDSVNNSYLRCELAWRKDDDLGLDAFLFWQPHFDIESKKATVNIGLSSQWKSKRLIRTMAGLIVVLFGIALLGVAITNAGETSDEFFIGCLVASVGMTFLGVLLTVYLRQLVRPERITDELVLLRGVHPDYLAMLPEFPAD